MRPALANGSRGRPAHLHVPGGRRPPGFRTGSSIERSEKPSLKIVKEGTPGHRRIHSRA
jgi:hypothetical protein